PLRQQLGRPHVLARIVHVVDVLVGAVTDGLTEHRRDDAVRRPLHQLAGEAAADAVAHVEKPVDAEMVHQPELVVGEGFPRVAGRNRAGRLAAIGVALVHRDAAEIALERLRRVEDGGWPVADAGVEATARRHQQRETGAAFLIADADIAALIEGHRRSPYWAAAAKGRAAAACWLVLRNARTCRSAISIWRGFIFHG